MLQVELSGGRPELLEVTIDPVRMEAYRITATEIATVIRSNNQLVPAGNLETSQGKFAVKVRGVVEGPEDVLSLPIKVSGDRVVTLGDVAEVRRTFREPTSLSRIDGQPSLSLGVVKRTGANILDTVAGVRRAVAAEEGRCPETIQASFTFDESDYINRTLVLLESKDPYPQIQASRLIWMILKGLEKSKGSPIDLISVVPASEYPKNPKIVFGYHRWKHDPSGGYDYIIPYINIIIIKHITRLLSALVLVSRWLIRNRRHKDKKILIYPLCTAPF